MPSGITLRARSLRNGHDSVRLRSSQAQQDSGSEPVSACGSREQPRRLNPFTKKMGDVERNQPLSNAEVAAVLQVIERADPEWPLGARGFCTWRFERSTVEISWDGLGHGCSLAVRGLGLSLDFAELLFEMLAVGNWILLDDSAAAVASEAVLQDRPREEFAGAVVVP